MQNTEELVVASALELLRGGSDISLSSPPSSGAASIVGESRSDKSSACSTPASELHASQALFYSCAPSLELVSVPQSGSRPPSNPLTPLGTTPHSQALGAFSPAVNAVPRSASTAHSGPPHRGRISGMLLTATSMLISREARTQLQHLVRMLRLANDHLSGKVERLRESMEADSAGIEGRMSAGAVRQDIVNTVRKCLKLLSTFASNKLPERARFAVRGCLLGLPNQCAQKMSTVSSPNTESAILSLATETLDTLQNVINILDDVLGRAETWCGTKADAESRKPIDEKLTKDVQLKPDAAVMKTEAATASG